MNPRIPRQIVLFSLLEIALLFGPLAVVGQAETAAELVAQLRELPAAKRQAFLEAGAKKEGTFILYGTTAVDHANKILAGFRRRYPFIKTRLYRSGSTALLRKILTEARAGRHDADVINTAPGPFYELKRAGLLERYRSPNQSAVRKGMMEKKGYWTGLYHIVVVVAYNTEQVRKEDIPKSYEDLLHPKWKGKIHIDTQDADWFHTLLEYWGEEKGMTYMKKLAAQKPEIRTGHTLATQLLAVGEFSLSPVLYGYRVNQMMAQGAPIDFVLIDPVISKPRGVALAKYALHPHAAILYLDWALSPEGQSIIGQKLGRSPVRKGMKSKYERLDHPTYVTVNAETFAPMYKKRLEQYADIFQFR